MRQTIFQHTDDRKKPEQCRLGNLDTVLRVSHQRLSQHLGHNRTVRDRDIHQSARQPATDLDFTHLESSSASHAARRHFRGQQPTAGLPGEDIELHCSTARQGAEIGGHYIRHRAGGDTSVPANPQPCDSQPSTEEHHCRRGHDDSESGRGNQTTRGRCRDDDHGGVESP